MPSPKRQGYTRVSEMSTDALHRFSNDTEALLKRLHRDTTVRMLSALYQDEAA